MRLPDLGDLTDVNGLKLWMHRAGAGDPVVVFVPGGGAFGLDYFLAHERVAGFTTSVLYDRAGTGWSDDIELPRSLDEVTDELRTLLRNADLPAPYVLVGHSLGGAYVQRYAQRFPDEVAALLLLDPAHQDYDDYMPQHLKLATAMEAGFELPELSDDFVSQVREVFTTTFAALPDSIREQVIDLHVSAGRLPTGMREGTNVLALFEELHTGGPLPDVPLIVLSGAGTDANQTMFQPEELVREQVAASQHLYDAIAAKAPQGEHRSLPDASHVTIPIARPDAVAQAARDLLDTLLARRR